MKLISLLVLLLLVCSVCSHLIDGSWKTINATFTPRDKHSVACVGSDIYVFGGRESATTLADTMFKYSTTTNQFVQIYADHAPPTFGTNLYRVGKYLYQFGGQTDPTTMTNDMWRYDTERNSWQKVQKQKLWPPASAKFGGVERNNGFVIFLGVAPNGLTNEVWAFDGLTESWSLAHSGTLTAPSPRFDPCCTYVPSQDSTYCWGGTDVTGDTNDMWRFSHASSLWLRISPAGTQPTSRRLAVCSLLNTNSATSPTIAFHAGWDSNNLVFVNDTAVHTFNVIASSWTRWEQHVFVSRTEPTQLVPRDSAKMCSGSGGVFMLGGGTELDNNLDPEGRLNDVWYLDETDRTLKNRIPNSVKPSPRHGHNLVVVGSFAWLFFGQDESGAPLNDVWRLDLSTLEWEAVIPVADSGGRYGASAAAFGTTVYFFGGFVSGSQLTNELLSFSTIGLDWTTIEQKGSIPLPRAYHESVFYGSNLLVLGGATKSSLLPDTLHVFSTQHQSWFDVDVDLSNAQSIGQRASFGFLVDKFTNTSLSTERLRVFGGYQKGLHTRRDRLIVDSIKLDATKEVETFNAKGQVLSSRIPSGDGVKSYNRAEAAVGGSGNHYFICGGTIDTSFPMAIQDTCYQYDANTQENHRMGKQPDVSVYGGKGVFFGDKFVMFGGRLVSETLKRSIWTNALQVFEVSSAALCRTGSMDDSGCIHCSAGTFNPSPTAVDPQCQVGAAGTYHANSFSSSSDASSCPAGRMSPLTGATSVHFCRLCPAGYYAASSSTCESCANDDCPFGSSDKNTVRQQSAENTTVVESEQPPPYDDPPVPLWIFLILALSVFGVGLTLLLLWLISGTGAETMVHYYMLPEHEEKLNIAYERYKTPGFGLKEVDLLNALYDFGIHTIDMETACEEFRLHDLDGSSHIAIDELRMLICSLFRKQKVPCLQGTQAYENNKSILADWKIQAEEAERKGEVIPRPQHQGPQRCVEKILMALHKFKFSEYDKYTGNHLIGKMGDVIKIQATTGGGIATLAFYLLTLVLVAALVLTFWYRNVIETKGTVPSVALNETITSDIRITIESLGGLGASSQGQCSGQHSSNPRHCSGSHSTLEVVQKEQTQFPALQFDEEETQCNTVGNNCLMEYNCKSCTIRALQTMHFDFSLTPDSFAQQIRVTVTASTGITDPTTQDVQTSSVSMVLSPQEGTVFRGSPASVVNVRLVPTKFQTFKNSFQQTPAIIKTGYHAQIVSSVIGNSVNHKNFNQFASVPVRVSLVPGDTVLFVERKPSQSILQLITSILGAISGLSGGLLSLVTFGDGRAQKQREAIRQKALDREDRKQFKQYLEDAHDEERIARDLADRAFVQDLVDQSVNIQVAQAHLRLIRKCIDVDKNGTTSLEQLRHDVVEVTS